MVFPMRANIKAVIEQRCVQCKAYGIIDIMSQAKLLLLLLFVYYSLCMSTCASEKSSADLFCSAHFFFFCFFLHGYSILFRLSRGDSVEKSFVLLSKMQGNVVRFIRDLL